MKTSDQNQTFMRWMQGHLGILHKVARSFSDQAAGQEDLVQEIQIAVWHAVPHFAAGSKVSSYIYRIALNRAISWVRRERAYRSRIGHLGNGVPEPVSSAPEDPRLELIYAEIRRLPKTDRALILLQLDGFSYEEIAQTLGLSPTNVGVRLTRVRRRLAANLKDQ